MDPQPVPSAGQNFLKNVLVRFRVQEIARKWMKLAKKSKQRYYKLKEWSDTEEAYLRRLARLRDEVREPLKAHQLINELEEVMMFASLDSMIQLGLEMKGKIDALLATWSPIHTQLAPTVESLAIYLKIYKEYSNNFQKADKLLQQLKKTPKFREVVKLEYVEDFLIKPVQRPLQYKLFVSDYLKMLPPQHTDRQDLAKALKTLLRIADEINEFVESQMRSAKMVQLDKEFGDVIESSRIFKTQFDAETAEGKCRFYVLNDLILGAKLISRQKQEPFIRINLCGGSYVLRQPDSMIFKNRVYICGSYQSIHFTLPSPADADKIHELLENIINDIYEREYHREALITKARLNRETLVGSRYSIRAEYKWKEQPRYRMRLKVMVEGVEKRYYENQWRIIYTVRIQLGKPEGIYQLAFYEIEDLRDIEKYLSMLYPNLKLPSLDIRFKGMSPDDLKADFPKYAEYRALIIEDFLNAVLRNPTIAQRPELIAYRLRIHEALWDYLYRLACDPEDCSCQACAYSEAYTDIECYERQCLSIKKGLKFCIRQTFNAQNAVAERTDCKAFKHFTLEQKLLWATCKAKRIDYDLLGYQLYAKPLTFLLTANLISEESCEFITQATANSTCREVVEIFCRRRGIVCSRDLALVFVNDKYEHELDDDEYIIDYVKYLDGGLLKEESEKKRNRNTLQNITGRKTRLLIRKLYVRPVGEEERACEENFERYPLVLGEMLRRFKEQHLLLAAPEVKLFCALFYSLEEFHTIMFSNKVYVQEDKVRRYLPESKWGLVSPEFIQELRAIIENQVKLCDKITLLYRCILKQFGEKAGWLTKFFQVENKDPTSLSGNNKQLLLGVNCRKVLVTRKHNLASLLEFPLPQFQHRCSGNSVVIETEGKTYELVGHNLLLFDRMVRKYRLICEFEQA